MSKTILYSLAFIALGLGSGSLGSTLPALAAQTRVGMREISSMFIARSLGTMIGSYLIGRFYDRVKGHPLLALSLIAAAAAMALIPSGWIVGGRNVLAVADRTILQIARVAGDGVDCVALSARSLGDSGGSRFTSCSRRRQSRL